MKVLGIKITTSNNLLKTHATFRYRAEVGILHYLSKTRALGPCWDMDGELQFWCAACVLERKAGEPKFMFYKSPVHTLSLKMQGRKSGLCQKRAAI